MVEGETGWDHTAGKRDHHVGCGAAARGKLGWRVLDDGAPAAVGHPEVAAGVKGESARIVERAAVGADRIGRRWRAARGQLRGRVLDEPAVPVVGDPQVAVFVECDRPWRWGIDAAGDGDL